MEENLNMASPWVVYYKKVQALFSCDSNVRVELDEDNDKITIYASGLMGKKADAIRQLMPTQVEMGNITLTIDVVSSNDEEPTYEELVELAFYHNYSFVGIVGQDHGMFGQTNYGAFKDTTVQFYSDDLTQLYGNSTYVLADLAREIMLPHDSFYFSTCPKSRF